MRTTVEGCCICFPVRRVGPVVLFFVLSWRITVTLRGDQPVARAQFWPAYRGSYASPALLHRLTVPDSLFLQSRNCDGGLQEFNSASACVQEVFPGCDIANDRVDAYPIQVLVTAHVDGRPPVVVWKGRQQSLFRKYPDVRTQTMEEIKAKLQSLQKEIEGQA